VNYQEINVYVVLINNEKILILKRKNDIWEFAGGKIEWGENPKDAAIRETAEETGIIPYDLMLVGITSATYPKDENEKHSLYLVYLGRCADQKITLSDEHTEGRWLSLNEIKYMKLGLNAESIPELIEDLIVPE